MLHGHEPAGAGNKLVKGAPPGLSPLGPDTLTAIFAAKGGHLAVWGYARIVCGESFRPPVRSRIWKRLSALAVRCSVRFDCPLPASVTDEPQCAESGQGAREEGQPPGTQLGHLARPLLDPRHPARQPEDTPANYPGADDSAAEQYCRRAQQNPPHHGAPLPPDDTVSARPNYPPECTRTDALRSRIVANVIIVRNQQESATRCPVSRNGRSSLITLRKACPRTRRER